MIYDLNPGLFLKGVQNTFGCTTKGDIKPFSFNVTDSDTGIQELNALLMDSELMFYGIMTIQVSTLNSTDPIIVTGFNSVFRPDGSSFRLEYSPSVTSYRDVIPVWMDGINLVQDSGWYWNFNFFGYTLDLAAL